MVSRLLLCWCPLDSLQLVHFSTLNWGLDSAKQAGLLYGFPPGFMLVHFRVVVVFFPQKLALLTALNFGNVCSCQKTCWFLKWLILPVAVVSQLNMYGSNSSFKIVLANWRNGLKFIKNKCEVLQLSNTRLNCFCPSTHIQTCYQLWSGSERLQSKLG